MNFKLSSKFLSVKPIEYTIADWKLNKNIFKWNTFYKIKKEH